MDGIVNEYFESGEDTSREATGAAERDGSWDQSAYDRKQGQLELLKKRVTDRVREERRFTVTEQYRVGDLSKGFTSEEALEYLQELRDKLSADQFRAAMKRALDNLPADQRAEVAALMRRIRRERGAEAAAGGAGAARSAPLPDLTEGRVGDEAAGGEDAGDIDIDEILERLRTGGLIEPETGSGGHPSVAAFGAWMDSPLTRAVLGGIAAYATLAAAELSEEEGAPPASTA